MRIVLEYLAPETFPRPEGWTVVGFVDGAPLVYDPARQPHRMTEAGAEPLDRDEVKAALAPAVDAAASKLWPGGWAIAFSEVFGVHRRSLAAERLARQGLPPGVLQALAMLADNPDAEGVGWLMGALARYADAHAQAVNPSERIDEALAAAANAAAGLRLARRGKPLRAEDDNTVP